MGAFIKGDVVVLRFPFMEVDLAKRRPALVLASLRGGDIIVCMITSKEPQNTYAIPLHETDFIQGSLQRVSFIRANRIFTTASTVVIYKAGSINTLKITEVIRTLIHILEQ